MPSDGVQFDRETARRVVEATRRVERMPPPSAAPKGRPLRSGGPRKRWYRIVTNEGSGAYTVRLQNWTGSALADVSDTFDPGYNVNAAALDLRGHAAGIVDDVVEGWEVFDDGEYVILIDAILEVEFWAKITGNAAADSPAQNRWVYAWNEVYKSSAGYGGWADVSGGLSGTTETDPARNTIEDMNTGADAHVEGNGVDPANLDPDGDSTDEFAIMPATTGVIVWMRRVRVGSAIEYWFNYENGVDGSC